MIDLPEWMLFLECFPQSLDAFEANVGDGQGSTSLQRYADDVVHHQQDATMNHHFASAISTMFVTDVVR